MRLARLGALALAVLLPAAASCNVALGIDPEEYVDAGVELCECEGVGYYFSECQSRIRSSLEKASESEREAWLGTYDDLDCGSCDTTAILSCLQKEPVCRERGEDCAAPLDCCGTLTGDGACVEGRCRECLPEGEACLDSSACCGFGLRTGYCHDGACYREAPACAHTFAACTEDSQCCGSESGQAGCSNMGYCVETCYAPGAPNCPACCGVVTSDTDYRICFDGADAAALIQAFGGAGCADLCDPDVGCGDGRSCEGVSVQEGTSFYLCLPG